MTAARCFPPHAHVLAAVCAALAITAASSLAAPVIGFREHFPGVSLAGWQSGSATSNPGTGGVLGAGDGFLVVSVPGPFAGNLGAFSPGAAYLGNWTAAGVTQVRLWLTDTGNPQPMEIHFGIGNGGIGNFWQCNTGFIPPAGEWAPFTVDLTNTANFSFIGAGTGTFAAALGNVDRILLRHDLAPYVQSPNTIVGDFGLDEILLTNGVAGVDGPGARITGSPVRLAPPAPNPSRGAVAFRMQVSDESPVRIQVVDAAGRVVRSAELPGGAPGERSWTWDGAADDGRMMAAGYYRVRAFGRSGGMSQPLVRIR